MVRFKLCRFLDLFIVLQVKFFIELTLRLYYGFKSENSHYQKLWTHLDKREKHALRSTKLFSKMESPV